MCKLVNWLNSNRLAVNVSKTNFVIFSAKNKPLKPVTIIINRKPIEQKDHVKYLGILIDSKLSFKQHNCHYKENLKSYQLIIQTQRLFLKGF